MKAAIVIVAIIKLEHFVILLKRYIII